MPNGTRAGRRVANKGHPILSALKTFGLSIYVILVVISALIVGFYLYWQVSVKPPELPSVTEPAHNPVMPAAPVGGDKTDPAAEQSEQQTPAVPVRARREGVYTFVLLGQDKGSGNTDSIILVTYDTAAQRVGMVSVPRDTIVRRDWSSNLKINAAYGMKGPDTLKRELENTFGIPVDFYVWVSLRGFIALVDQLGGVDVYIPSAMNYDDPAQDLSIHYTAGQKHLTGQQAMEVVRFRHNNDGTGYNDEGRAAMQRTVLTALAKKALSWNSLTKLQSFVDIFRKYVKTDMSKEDMLYFVSQAVHLDPSEGLQQGALECRSDAIYKSNHWACVFEAEKILPTLNDLLNPYDVDLTAQDLDLIKAERFYFKQ